MEGGEKWMESGFQSNPLKSHRNIWWFMTYLTWHFLFLSTSIVEKTNSCRQSSRWCCWWWRGNRNHEPLAISMLSLRQRCMFLPHWSPALLPAAWAAAKTPCFSTSLWAAGADGAAIPPPAADDDEAPGRCDTSTVCTPIVVVVVVWPQAETLSNCLRRARRANIHTQQLQQMLTRFLRLVLSVFVLPFVFFLFSISSSSSSSSSWNWNWEWDCMQKKGEKGKFKSNGKRVDKQKESASVSRSKRVRQRKGKGQRPECVLYIRKGIGKNRAHHQDSTRGKAKQ